MEKVLELALSIFLTRVPGANLINFRRFRCLRHVDVEKEKEAAEFDYFWSNFAPPESSSPKAFLEKILFHC